MDRRGVLATLGYLLVLGGVPPAKAQRANGTRRIGWLALDEIPEPGSSEGFLTELRARGWIEGKNLVIERRSAGRNRDRLRHLADELVRLDVEVIITLGTPATLAARAATSRIPIVMSLGSDPVGIGVAESLARPGGNATGYTSNLLALEVKILGLLREVLPAVERVGQFIDPANEYWEATRKARERAFESLGLRPVYAPVTAADQVDGAVDQARRQGAQALVVPRDAFWYRHRQVLARASMRARLPAFAADDDMSAAGLLLSLAPDESEGDRILANYVERILRGAKPADLPVQQPTRFVLSVNLRTAKALGVAVPQSLLLRADEVIR